MLNILKLFPLYCLLVFGLSNQSFAQAKKKLFYTNPYEAIDLYAYKTPSSKSKDIKLLAEYLTAPAKNDMEKVRAIYIWVTTHISYDHSYKKNKPECSALNTLIKKKSVCEGFARLFNELCSEAGFSAEFISGYGKEFSNRKKRLTKNELHAWNAVFIDGEWKLFDVTWGATGHSVYKQKNKIYSKFDDFWFATDPHFFLLYHFPNEDRWQLIPNKITQKDFKSLPTVRDSFQRLNFSSSDIISYYQSDIKHVQPMTYDTPFPITQINCPDTRTLSVDSVYTFTFKCDFASEILIRDNKNAVVFDKSGNTFTARFQPSHLLVNIYVIMLDNPSTAHAICSYQTEDTVFKIKGN
ncbi:MAG: transglutaminase domain-containing protein [Flavobacteriales bacterium]